MASATEKLTAAPPAQRAVARRKRAVNWPVLLGTLALVVIAAPCAYYLREYQVARTAEIYRDRAAQKEADGDRAGAIQYLFRYTKFRPRDGAARAKLATLYAETADNYPRRQRAIELHEEAIGFASEEERAPLQVRLVELLLQNKRLEEAKQKSAEFERYFKDQQDSEASQQPQLQDEYTRRAMRVYALARYRFFKTPVGESAQRNKEDIGQRLEQAWAVNRDDLDLAVTLAHVYRNEPELLPGGEALAAADRSARADHVMQELVDNDAESPVAHLVHSQYLRQYGLTSAADAELAEALKLGPEVEAIRLAKASALRDQAAKIAQDGRQQEADDLYAEAIAHLEHVTTKINPKSEAAYVLHGEILAEQGQPGEAIAVWGAGLAEEKAGDSITLALRIANLEAQEEPKGAASAIETLDEVLKRRTPFITSEQFNAVVRTRNLIESRRLLADGKAADAIALLNDVTTQARGVGAQREDAIRGFVLLGQANERLQNFDAAARAYEEAVQLTGQNGRYRVLAANAWLAANRPQEAISQLNLAAPELEDPEVWLVLAQAEFGLAMHAPSAKRNWRPARSAIAEARRAAHHAPLERPWRLELLALEIDGQETGAFDAEGGKQKILADVRLLQEQFNDDPELIARLPSIYERLGASAEADRCLDQLDKIAPDSVARYVRRAELLARRDQRDEAQKVIDDGLRSLTDDGDRLVLQQLKVQLERLSGDAKSFHVALRQLHEQQPDDVNLMLQLMELALNRRDFGEAEEMERQIVAAQRIPSRNYRYLRILRLIDSPGDKNDENLKLAADEQRALYQQSPNWPLTHFADGRIKEKKNMLADAADAYQKAIALGDNRLAVYERLDRALRRLGRGEEADRYISQLEDRVLDSPLLSGSGIVSAIGKEDLAKAVQLAEEAKERRPHDLTAKLWLGQVRLLADDLPGAEAAFQEAKDQAPRDPRAWNGLFTYYMRSGQPDKAKALVDAMASEAESDQRPIDLDDVPLALTCAQGYALLGEDELATQWYKSAESAAPKDDVQKNFEVQMQIAKFYMRRDSTESKKMAEAALRKAVELQPSQLAAVLPLLQELAKRADDAGAQAEIDRLRAGLDAQDQGATQAFDRVRAAMLALRQSDSRVADLQRARKLLEKSIGEAASPSATNMILLAVMYGELSRVQTTVKARRELVALADAKFRQVVEGPQEPAPLHLLVYVNFLLDRGDHQAAEKWLAKLEASTPPSLATLAVRVRWLHAVGRDEEIQPLVDQLAQSLLEKAKTDAAREAIYLRAGQVLDSAEQYEAGGAWYGRLAVSKRFAELAINFAKQGRVQEAVQICLEAAKVDNSSKPPIVLATVLGFDVKEATPRAEQLLREALAAHADELPLLVTVGNLRLQQGQAEESVRLYEQAAESIEQRPDQVASNFKAMVLNNLATLLSDEVDRPQDALARIEEVIRSQGPSAALLDTKGTILLKLEDYKAARAALEVAATGSSTIDPRYRFHFAVALEKTGDRAGAKQHLQQALADDLLGQVLTSNDREMLRELLAELQLKLPS